jgi:DNA-binding transcriptional ArsR family regulator
VDSLDQLRATAHPVRLQLLSLLTGAALSAAECARELGISQANASYHLRLLERAELVSVVELVLVRGGSAKRYRHQPSSAPHDGTDAEPASTGSERESRRQLIAAMSAELLRRSFSRVEGASVTTDAELWLAPEAWQQVVALVREASTLLHASARPPRAPGTRPVAMTVALFPMTADDSGAPDDAGLDHP